MRSGLFIALVGALSGVAFAGAPVAASTDSWTVAPSADGRFSVETPCTTPEVIKFRSMPNEVLPGVSFSPDSRVTCGYHKVVLLAGEVKVANFPATGPSLFDVFIEQAKADKTAEGTPSMTTIDGRRAFLNRQEKNGVLAQTGLVEIDHAKIAMLVAGVDASSDMSLKDQAVLIDRFYASFKVTGK